MDQPATILTCQRRTKAGYAPSLVNPAWTDGLTADRGGWYAEVDLGESRQISVSRLDGEETWTIDALWVRGLPVFANGYGARYLVTREVEPGLGRLLDSRLPRCGATASGNVPQVCGLVVIGAQHADGLPAHGNGYGQRWM